MVAKFLGKSNFTDFDGKIVFITAKCGGKMGENRAQKN